MPQERFDMVVLATGLQPPNLPLTLSEMLGIELNGHGFCKTDKFYPLQPHGLAFSSAAHSHLPKKSPRPSLMPAARPPKSCAC